MPTCANNCVTLEHLPRSTAPLTDTRIVGFKQHLRLTAPVSRSDVVRNHSAGVPQSGGLALATGQFLPPDAC
jgi:hypothetical protein